MGDNVVKKIATSFQSDNVAKGRLKMAMSPQGDSVS